MIKIQVQSEDNKIGCNTKCYFKGINHIKYENIDTFNYLNFYGEDFSLINIFVDDVNLKEDKDNIINSIKINITDTTSLVATLIFSKATNKDAYNSFKEELKSLREIEVKTEKGKKKKIKKVIDLLRVNHCPYITIDMNEKVNEDNVTLIETLFSPIKDMYVFFLDKKEVIKKEKKHVEVYSRPAIKEDIEPITFTKPITQVAKNTKKIFLKTKVDYVYNGLFTIFLAFSLFSTAYFAFNMNTGFLVFFSILDVVFLYPLIQTSYFAIKNNEGKVSLRYSLLILISFSVIGPLLGILVAFLLSLGNILFTKDLVTLYCYLCGLGAIVISTIIHVCLISIRKHKTKKN